MYKRQLIYKAIFLVSFLSVVFFFSGVCFGVGLAALGDPYGVLLTLKAMADLFDWKHLEQGQLMIRLQSCTTTSFIDGFYL